MIEGRKRGLPPAEYHQVAADQSFRPFLSQELFCYAQESMLNFSVAELAGLKEGIT